MMEVEATPASTVMFHSTVAFAQQSLNDDRMNGSEARAVRIALGLTEDQLAASMRTTPAVVAAWESDRIKVPRSIAIDLTWQSAHLERLAALQASGLPTCGWVAAFETEPVPDKIKLQAAHFERLVEHAKSCETCGARDAFIKDRFPPMPPAPRHGIMAIIGPIAERIQRLPDWAQPAATGAALFMAYSLVRVLLTFSAIVRDPVRGSGVAIAGLLLSGLLGAVLGFVYGQYRRLRTRPRPSV
jgi:DNA-binding transcriptional regulator YiaG